MNAIAIDAHPSSQIQLTSLDLFDPLRPLDSPGPLNSPGPLDSPGPFDPPGLTILLVSQEPKLMQTLWPPVSLACLDYLNNLGNHFFIFFIDYLYSLLFLFII